jgi:cytoskeletal protein CcmA (bactofilin family)
MLLKKKTGTANAVEMIAKEEIPQTVGTVLASEVLFEGTFKSSEPMIIHGEVRGDIKSTSDITLSSEGKYTGTISSGNMVISGIANGTFTCRGIAEISESGKVKGDLAASRFIMSQDAIFEGGLKVKKSKKPSEEVLKDLSKEDAKQIVE